MHSSSPDPEFQEHFLPCYKRPSNIRDSLVKADLGMVPFHAYIAINATSVIKGDVFHHPHSGKRYNIKGYFTCDSSFVIYAIKCPCGLLYIGETTQPIRSRISKHKSTIRCQNLLLPLPSHFIAKGHNISQLRFQILEHIPVQRRGGNIIHLLKKKEAYWIHELQTLAPKQRL
ncbi:unnamed protein product [Ranitomeya imitator]|uniref:GIY-YIG domain-containing protein n=1 Tax=Ranitomeya imitator TaxID=111125 RepID=A0ABN9L121_9NEOB|nr:unnamed protein product [Ranitomeya imitator]